MKKIIGRRAVLKGIGGVALTLPVLEGLLPRKARAGGEGVEPYAIFFRQANGVAAEQSTNEIGMEPERFWPKQHGALTSDNVDGRAVGELSDHLDRLLLVSNCNMENFDYADGHARGAMQGLTAQGPVTPGLGGDSEANGESIDHRIGRELNPDGRDSLVLYAGRTGGWLGGPCIAYRGPGNRRAALHNPLVAYQTMMGLDSDQLDELIARQQSVNDLVRDQLQSLMSSPQLSSNDVQRLDLHLQSVRDLEDNLTCNFSDQQQMAFEGLSPGYDSEDGDEVLDAAKAHMHVAALAVACGYTRSVSIQIGSGNDGSTRYRNLDDNQLMENYHYISHRRASHDAEGAIIPNSDLLHHYVDIHFARTFKHLLDLLAAYELPNGEKLIDCGACVWFNDNGNGPAHSARNIPHVIAGGAAGFLKQGQYIELNGGEFETNHARMLNTIGSAVGLRKGNGDFIDDFGDPSLPKGILGELLA